MAPRTTPKLIASVLMLGWISPRWKCACRARSDHLAKVIHYCFQGVIHTSHPDFLIRLKYSDMLVLETKCKDDQQNRTKREFFDESVRAVRADGLFGKWKWAVSKSPADVRGILEKAMELEKR